MRMRGLINEKWVGLNLLSRARPALMPEVELSVLWKGKLSPSSLCVELDEEVTCRELVDQLTDPDEGWGRKGAWHLVERWNGCERLLPDGERVLEAVERWGWEGRVCLKGEAVKGGDVKWGRRRRGGRGRESSLRGQITCKKLYRLCHDLKTATISLSTQASTQWLQILAQRGPLVGGSAQNPLEPFKERFAELKKENLQLSTDISELNILAGGLSGELQHLRKKERDLSEGVRCVEEEVKGRRRERERETRSRVADLQTEAIRLRRELETRNKLNSAQSSKLQAQKDALAEKREAAALRREELARVKCEISQDSNLHETEVTQGSTTQSHDSHMTQPTQPRDSHMTQPAATLLTGAEHSAVATPPLRRGISEEGTHSLPSTPQSDLTPSTTHRKRAVFEARTRRQLEAEAEQFRRQKAGKRRGGGRENGGGKVVAKQLEFSSTAPEDREPISLLPSDLIAEGQKLLTVPMAESQWYRDNGSPDMSYREKIDRVLGGGTEKDIAMDSVHKGHLLGDKPESRSAGKMEGDFFNEVMASIERQQSVGGACKQSVVKAKKPRKVHFSPEALILPASLEGELDTVRHCVQQLGSCDQRSHKGATCLHNAVCSGHLPTVQYLVERGCDVNAQDEEGWTPLHCAVAYSNSAAVTYLLSHGACLWLVTEEGDTALALGGKELAAQRELGGKAGQAAAEHSLHCLEEAHRKIGVANRGVVYALFSRNAADLAEISLSEGEQLVVLHRGTGERGGEGGEGWWEVENVSAERGLAPCTYLGSASRSRVTF